MSLSSTLCRAKTSVAIALNLSSGFWYFKKHEQYAKKQIAQRREFVEGL